MENQCSRLSVAPMMEWTDRHCRAFHSLLAPHALLYTEMIISRAIVRGDRERLLNNEGVKAACALQLGGSDPRELAQAAEVGASFGYEEINLNAGCPSDRVQKGRFGACLMLEPATVAACVESMKRTVNVPVTVKCRIGVDEHENAAFLLEFASACVDAGVDHLIVHARKALLKGLSPKQNREVPPLNYDRASWLKKKLPQLPVTINGGIRSAGLFREMATRFDGVMIGRAAYQTPALLAELGTGIPPTLQDQRQFIHRYLPYIENELQRGTALRHMTRHLLGMFKGLPGGKHWRRVLSEEGVIAGAGLEVIEKALPVESGTHTCEPRAAGEGK